MGSQTHQPPLTLPPLTSGLGRAAALRPVSASPPPLRPPPPPPAPEVKRYNLRPLESNRPAPPPQLTRWAEGGAAPRPRPSTSPPQPQSKSERPAPALVERRPPERVRPLPPIDARTPDSPRPAPLPAASPPAPPPRPPGLRPPAEPPRDRPGSTLAPHAQPDRREVQLAPRAAPAPARAVWRGLTTYSDL